MKRPTHACQDTLRQLERWDSLSGSARQVLRDRAAECPTCEQQLAAQRRLLETLAAARQAHREVTYAGSLRRRPDAYPAKRPFLPRPLLWGALPAAALALILGLSVLRVPPTDESPRGPGPTPGTAVTPPGMRLPSGVSSVSASLSALRRQSLRLPAPKAPGRPAGMGFRMPPRPRPAAASTKPRKQP